jgi:hypothetical protein
MVNMVNMATKLICRICFAAAPFALSIHKWKFSAQCIQVIWC